MVAARNLVPRVLFQEVVGKGLVSVGHDSRKRYPAVEAYLRIGSRHVFFMQFTDNFELMNAHCYYSCTVIFYM